MTYMIIGASSGLGRALAERFASEGYSLVLTSRDIRDTDAVAADLRLRFEIRVATASLDLALPQSGFSQLDKALGKVPPLTGILIPAGFVESEDVPGQSAGQSEMLVRGNFLSICQLIDHYLPAIKKSERGTIIGFGSVAAIRGRRRNVAYAAAKRALESYFESLRHALTDSNVIVQFYVLGFLDTNLAFSKQTLLPKGSPAKLAQLVASRRERDFGRRVYPLFWYAIGFLLPAVPWALYRRFSF